MLDRLIKIVTSRFNLETDAVAAILRELLTMMADERFGGVNEFIAKFRTAGLDRLVDSWIGDGPNETLSPTQTRAALGRAPMDEIADTAGIGRGAIVPVLAFLVPLLVDAISPDGRLPTTGELNARTSRFVRGEAASSRTGSAVGGGLVRLAALAIPVIALAGAWFYLQTGAGIDPILAVSNAGGEVTFTAHVKDEAARATIIDALNTTFGEVRVKGDVSVDGGVKEAEWMPQVGDLMSALDTPGAELTLTGDSARVGGWLTEEERSSVAARVRGALGANIAVSETEDRRAEAVRTANARASAALAGLDSLEAADVRPERLVSALNLSVIDFADGRAEIPTSAGEILGRAARALLHTPTGTRIVVAGHTDAAGDSAANLALSEERARAVVSALVEEGVEPEMLTVLGYGGTRPVDPAATGSARFRNQRIEYAVAE